jgi:succinylglutamate desuccinylase
MTEVFSKALNESTQVDRFIGHYQGDSPGPTLIFIGGMHGNEPAGIFALEKVIKHLNKEKLPFKGNMYAISGNLNALEKGIRYKKVDLNRLWSLKKVDKIKKGKASEKGEENIEQQQLYLSVKNILEMENRPIYFFDLHTTSSKTIPFITVNDSLLNRKFTQQYPVPMILGIEEFLDGPLLSYINELGYVAFGFEGGQHDDIASIDNHVAFIYLSIVFCGSLKRSQIEYQKYYDFLFKNSQRSQEIYEIVWHHEIMQEEIFKMEPGFVNFQPIKKGQLLASSDGNKVVATENGRIFMPLYQGKGSDGFFTIRKVQKIFLNWSAVLRKIRFDKVLPLLPGVNWASEKKDELVVNLKVARLFTKQFFHILGYRSKQIDKTHLRMKNREAASRNEDYRDAPWTNRF